PVAIVAEVLALGAERLTVGAAEATEAAVLRPLRAGHAVAPLQRAHGAADLLHDARALVTEDQWEGDAALHHADADEMVVVADARGVVADEDLTRSERWHRDVPRAHDVEITRVIGDHRSHGDGEYTPPAFLGLVAAEGYSGTNARPPPGRRDHLRSGRRSSPAAVRLLPLAFRSCRPHRGADGPVPRAGGRGARLRGLPSHGSPHLVTGARGRRRGAGGRDWESSPRRSRGRRGEGLSGKAVQLGEPVLVEDIETDPRFGKPNDPKYGGGSFICMPLRVADRIIGVVNLAMKQSVGGTSTAPPFSRTDLQFLNTLMTYTAYAVDNAPLPEEAQDAARKLNEV